MPRSNLLSGLALATLLAAAPVSMVSPIAVSTATAQEARVNFNIFFDELAPHGTWVRDARYRYVWCPDVDVRWRPYTEGRWVYLRDRGWYFQSDEPYAWAVYHYGRWLDDARLGWCWVPGNQWAPAWVSWRHSNDYIGWAPLPPERDGFQIDIEITVGEPPQDDWVFVPVRRFVEPQLRFDLVLGSQEPEIYRRSEYAGPVVIQNNLVINTVIDIDIIQQQVEAPVPVVEANMVSQQTQPGDQIEEGTIAVFSPEIDAPSDEAAPAEALEPEAAAAQLPQAQAPDADDAGLPDEDPADDAATTDDPAAPEAAAGEDAMTEEPATETATGDEAAPPADVEADAEVEAEIDAEADVEAEVEADAAAPADAPAEPAPAPETMPEPEAMPDEAAPGEAPLEEAAPTPEAVPEDEAVPEEDAAPADEAVPEVQPGQPLCEEGLELIDDRCVPVGGDAAAEGELSLDEADPAQ